MRATWYVLEDGNVADPNECAPNESGKLVHAGGIAVAMRGDTYSSRGVDIDPDAPVLTNPPAKDQEPAKEPAKDQEPAKEPAKDQEPAKEPAKDQEPAKEPAKDQEPAKAETGEGKSEEPKRGSYKTRESKAE